MITVKTKIESKDLEKESKYIESISNDKESFLDLPNPKEKVRLRKAKWNPDTGIIEEDTS